jgi:glycosyltransferase involved in cell wall biosynthesis
LKIIQLVDSLAIGGAERMAVNMANVFSDNRIENILVCARLTGPLFAFLPENLKVVELNKKSFFDLISFRKLSLVIKRERPDIIHAHSSSIYWAIALKLFFPRTKLVWHDHDGLSERLKDTDRKTLKLFSGYIDGIITVNQILKSWSERNMRVRRIIYLRNFPYLSPVTPVLKDKYIILHLANLRPQKDHFTLIEAIRLLKNRELDSFEVWCAGADNGDSYSSSVRKIVKKYDLEREIKFLGGVVNTNSLLAKASLGILSSISEGLPVSLLEYGLASLPVVVTNVGQCSEVVGDLKSAILISPRKPEELADAIQWHMHNKDESVKWGLNFKNHIEMEYGSSGFLRNYLNFIVDI